MKKYKVTVNGTAYEIELEVIDAADVKASPAVASPAAAPAKEEAPKAAPAPVSAPAGGETIAAPMPGNILSVNVKEGQSVKKGDVLLILEAMKMENEIMSPVDGTVTSVNVASGSTVETGATLCVIG